MIKTCEFHFKVKIDVRIKTDDSENVTRAYSFDKCRGQHPVVAIFSVFSTTDSHEHVNAFRHMQAPFPEQSQSCRAGQSRGPLDQDWETLVSGTWLR